MDDFEDFFKEIEDDFSYLLPGEKEFISMKKELLKKQNSNKKSFLNLFKIGDDSDKLIKKTEQYFAKKKRDQLKKSDNHKWLINGLEKEFSRILINDRARIGVSLKIDNEYYEATQLLSDLNEYYSLLGY